jgi:hypothetical protein
MAYSAMQVANAFIQKALDGKIPDLTPMKLQKLMFFAQSWYLKKYRVRLINDEFVRWRFGPVIQSVYYEFSSVGGGLLTENKVFARDARGEIVTPSIASNDDAFLDAIVHAYGNYSGWQLSDMSHAAGGAWLMQPQGSIITNVEMFNGRV